MWRDNKLLLGGGMILAALSGATAASALTSARTSFSSGSTGFLAARFQLRAVCSSGGRHTT
jgi:hypothetical protein